MRKPLLAITFLASAAAGAAQAEPVAIFAAGSLKGVVSDLGKETASALGITVNGSFGGSGLMRERIEKGEKPDLLMSADVGSPKKLEDQGRTTVPVIVFARNRECVVSRKDLAVTPANLAAKLLDPSVRLKTSQPIADPSGDYTWAIFDKIDAQRPGAGKVLKDKAQTFMDVTAAPTTPGQTAQAALFAAGKIDMTIVYCSAAVDKEAPGLVSFPVPATLDPHPVYGVAVLSTKPEAMRVALYLLSDKGQAIIAKNGLVPVAAADH